MKTVLHHNKVYHINDWTYEAFVKFVLSKACLSEIDVARFLI